MKILHIISGNDNGGGANHVINICSAPLEKYSSSICCIGLGELINMAKIKNIETITFSVKEILSGKLLTYVKNNSIDLVNFHGPKANFIYLLIGSKMKVTCVVTVHSDYRYDFMNSKFKQKFFTILSELGLRKFNYYICASRYIKDTLDSNEFIGDKYIVNNGINFSSMIIKISKEQIRESLEIKESDFIYTMVARMHPIKNHKNLIKAFNKLTNDYSNVKLLLVGDGEEAENLKCITRELNIENKVIFAGFKANRMDYINASDITMLTSLNEGGAPPLVVLESALAKKTTICSNVGDMGDIINETNGYLMDSVEVDDIYIKMKKAYLEKETLAEKGVELHKCVIDRFSIENFWNRYYDSYKKILSKGK